MFWVPETYIGNFSSIWIWMIVINTRSGTSIYVHKNLQSRPSCLCIVYLTVSAYLQIVLFIFFVDWILKGCIIVKLTIVQIFSARSQPVWRYADAHHPWPTFPDLCHGRTLQTGWCPNYYCYSTKLEANTRNRPLQCTQESARGHVLSGQVQWGIHEVNGNVTAFLSVTEWEDKLKHHQRLRRPQQTQNRRIR